MIGYGSGNTPPPPSAWSTQPETLTGEEVVGDTALGARVGIARFELYLAKQAAFAAYLKETGRS